MASVISRGYRIDYTVDGDGPALLVVCGFSQWADQWESAGYTDALTDRFRVVRIDPLGHGRSDKPHDPSAYVWRSVIDDLIAVADAERIDEAIWWGFSRGAGMVLDLGHLYPDRVLAAVVGSEVESFGAAEWPDEPFPELCRTEDGLVSIWAALGFTDPAGITEALARNDCAALAAVAEVDGEFLVYDSYPATVRLLSYKGSREAYAESMSRLLDSAAADQHEVADANHYEAFARSADVLAFVEPFLTRVTAEHAR
jgi:pimeloyl-ACP methyl ester carboxylesterase